MESKYLESILDGLSELVYVTDLQTNDLLYINKTGLQTFHLESLPKDKKCYQILHGKEEPCEFCTNALLDTQKFYNWEITNHITNRHYLLKDKLIVWNGKIARLEIAFDITEKEKQKVELQSALKMENIVLDCVKLLHTVPDYDMALQKILEKIGRFMDADRTYIFEIHGNQMSNSYEWCKNDIEPQIENLQDLPITLILRWQESFQQNLSVIIEEIESIRDSSPEEYKVLQQQDIRNLVVVPLKLDEKWIGYIGVDNPPIEKAKNISSMLELLGCFISDSLQKRKSTAMLNKLSYYDTLTSAKNRNAYIYDIEQTFHQFVGSIGFVFADVNGLKDANDQYGHSFGDHLLIQVAKEISSVFGKENFYRIGGDEFVVICPEIEKKVFYEKYEKLRHLLSENGVPLASVGCEWSKEEEDINEVIKRADAKMYIDKREYHRTKHLKDRFRNCNKEVLHFLEENEIERILKEGRLLVVYQPKISVKDFKLLGAEALSRFRASNGEIILPDEFVPLLEESQMIDKIDFFVIEQVCIQLKEWIKKGKKPIPISVNLAQSTVLKDDFCKKLMQIWEKYCAPKELLEFEMSKGAQRKDQNILIQRIEQLRKSGFLIAMDDYGAENMNFLFFISTDFHTLKINRSVTANILSDKKAREFVGSIAEACAHSGIQMIVEGVETEEEFSVLKEIGCEGAQGFYFSKPLPIEEFEQRFMDQKGKEGLK